MRDYGQKRTTSIERRRSCQVSFGGVLVTRKLYSQDGIALRSGEFVALRVRAKALYLHERNLDASHPSLSLSLRKMPTDAGSVLALLGSTIVAIYVVQRVMDGWRVSRSVG